MLTFQRQARIIVYNKSLNQNGAFSIKLFSEKLVASRESSYCYSYLWPVNAPPKILGFYWMAMLG